MVKQTQYRFLVGSVVFLLVNLILLSAHAAERQVLQGHVPEAVTRLQSVNPLDSSKTLNLSIGLPLRDPAGLHQLLHDLYDPTSPNYRRYLKPAQFAERFGPAPADYQAVIDFMKANGLRVTGTHPNRVVLDVVGSVAAIERVLHVTLREYQHPLEARKFYAPDTEPTLDLAVPILHISGLDNYALPHPNFRVKPAPHASQVTPLAGAAGGQYIGNDFRAAYVPGVSLTGNGQSVALLEYDGYYASDISNYEALAGLPAVTLTNILINGGPITPGGGDGEVSLDIEMAVAMAPNLSQILVYEGTNGVTAWLTILDQIADDDLANQVSCSWSGGSPDPSSEQIFEQMAVQGQSFFNAVGDTDAFTGAIGFPSDSTNVTECGGTTLSTTGPGGSYVSELVWNEGTPNPNGGDWGSSGGVSTYYSIPPWQQGVATTTNQASSTMRNVPDVALVADNIYVAYDNGGNGSFGGTSCAAPLWAAFTALVNQQAAANGAAPVGFLNPALYAIGKGPNYTFCFHDITVGNNEWSPGSLAKYSAVPGYDLCTGWGTPNGANLLNALLSLAGNSPSIISAGSVVTGGNGNGVIDYDDCVMLSLPVVNIGGGTATVVNATLTTSTPGVTITQPNSTYAALVSGAVITNNTPFRISTSPSFVCGTPIPLSLVVSYTGGSSTNTLTMPTCQCPAIQVTGGLSHSSSKQSGAVFPTGIASTCGAAKSCPGTFAAGTVAYKAYSYTNSSSAAVCVSVTVSTTCGTNDNSSIFSEAYLGSYNPSSLCENYLADMGGLDGDYTGPGAFVYSFTVPANTNFTVVVNGMAHGYYCSDYSLTVAGLLCPVDGGGACSGGSAQLSVSPGSLNYGALTVGQSSTQSLNVINAGQVTLTGNASASTPFAVVSNASYSVSGGATGVVRISFAPGSAGAFTNNAIFTSNGGVATNTLTGTGLTPPQQIVNPGSLTFGTIATGTTAQASFVVTNTGGANLIGTAATGGSFAIIAGGSYNIAGFGATNVVVSFTPQSVAGFATNVVFASNGGGSANAVAGTGAAIPVAAFTGSPVAGVVPLTVTFTDASTGTITNRFWNFGDSATTNTSATTVLHTYNSPGTDSVVLAVSGPLGSSLLTNLNYIIVTNVIPQADLILGVSTTPTPVLQGQNLSYNLGLTNFGPADASAVTVTDALPAGVTFISATPTQGNCTNIGGVVSCNLGVLGAGSNALVAIVVNAPTPALLTNTAVAFTTTMDPNLTNNMAVTITPVLAVADLAISGAGTPNPVLTSQNLTYSLTVTNFGPSPATSVTVTDALPASLNFVSASVSIGTLTNNGNLVTCALGTLASNATATVMIVTAPTASTNITNVMNTVTVSANEFDPATTNNTVSPVVTVYLDSVGDGIPDWWRQLYFGSGSTTNSVSCVTCDASGSGFDNLQDYLAGMVPTNASSALAITTVAPSGGVFVVTFNSVIGKSYALESTTNLAPPAWATVTTITATGVTTQVTDPSMPPPPIFYRVRLLP